jgi:hypothetical protein
LAHYTSIEKLRQEVIEVFDVLETYLLALHFREYLTLMVAFVRNSGDRIELKLCDQAHSLL